MPHEKMVTMRILVTACSILLGVVFFTAPNPFSHLPFALSAHQCARGHRELELLYSANRELPVSRITVRTLGSGRKPECRDNMQSPHMKVEIEPTTFRLRDGSADHFTAG